MPNWWKCKIAENTLLIPFASGTIVFAKNGEEYITLFDGEKEARISKRAQKHIRLLSRLDAWNSEIVQMNYQLKNPPEKGSHLSDQG